MMVIIMMMTLYCALLKHLDDKSLFFKPQKAFQAEVVNKVGLQTELYCFKTETPSIWIYLISKLSHFTYQVLRQSTDHSFLVPAYDP